MKLTTPPKPIPPCHNAAAIGTLPIEHTKLMTAMNGPSSDVLERRPETVPVQEQGVPPFDRHEHREESGDEVTDRPTRAAAC